MCGNYITRKKLTEQGMFIMEKRGIRKFDCYDYSAGP